MEYKKAAQIRKKGLFELIAENKFSKEKSIGASIGGAISDKMKAKAVGIKEKFDPLNMVKALTGDGFIGKSIRTVAGRAMGRSEEHIRHFGGYGSRKRKLKETKDPLFTTIGSGAIVKIKSGDSISNILAKMYSFMEKTYETRRLNTELEDAFRKEQIDEDERRHKKLIESILNKKPTAVPEDDGEKEKSFIEKLLDGIKTALGPIISGLAAIVSWAVKLGEYFGKVFGKTFLTNMVKSVVTAIMAAENILSSLSKALFGFLKPAIVALVAALILAHEYEKIRSDSSRAGEAQRAAANLEKGPIIKKGEMSDALAGNITNEAMEDYTKGNLGLYDNVPIPDTGGKSAPLLLTDNEAKELKSNFEGLQQNYNVLQKFKNNEIDPKEIDLDKLKQAIADQKLNIGSIQQKGISRLKFQGSRKEWRIPGFGTYTSNQAKEDIGNLIKTYSKPDSKNQVDKGIFESYKDDTVNAALKMAGLDEIPEMPKLKLPEIPRIPEIPTKNIPDMLPDNLAPDGEWNKPGTLNVYGNNSQNTIGGGPAKMVDGSSTPVRNLALQKHFRPAVV